MSYGLWQGEMEWVCCVLAFDKVYESLGFAMCAQYPCHRYVVCVLRWENFVVSRVFGSMSESF
jgi:hypothetical protein